jgi:hypothetical protein
MKIIHEKCSTTLAEDKTLPLNSYIVSYFFEEDLFYDIVQSSSRVNIFDYYYDKYKNVKSINYTKGTINPKLYGIKSKETRKRRNG